VKSYPTIVVLDATDKEIQRFNYLSSAEMLKSLRR
jgi:hypothetical protein